MHDPGAMRAVQSVRDLDPESQNLFGREGAFPEPIRQRLPLEIFHDEIFGLAFPPHVVERADVRVRELRDRLGFSLETLADLLALGEMLGQHLDRDRSLEPRVPSLVDLSHSASADRRDDLVWTEAAAGRKR